MTTDDLSVIEPLNEDELLHGGAALLLLFNQHEWMHRRVENVAFLDDRSIKRRVSVDLTVAGADLLVIERLPFIPLAFLDKDVLVAFDARDESGASVPTLTKAQNGRIAWATLYRMAAHALEVDGPLSDELSEELRLISTGSRVRAQGLLSQMEERASKGEPVATALMGNWMFESIAYDLATKFLLLAAVDDEPGSRRVLKFSYVTPLAEPRDWRSRLERLASQMGWIPAEFDFVVPAVGEAASYHFEFTSPSELQIRASQVMVENNDEIYVAEGIAAGSRTHTYVGAEDPQAEGIVSVWLRAPRTGLLRAGLVVSALTALVLIFFLDEQRITRIEANEPVAILLAVPALVSSFIVRPGEHSLATRLLVGVRLAVGLSGLSAYVAAALLVGEVSNAALLCWWRVLAVLAAICFVSTLVAFVGLPPIGWIGETRIPVTLMEEDEAHGEEG